VVVVDPELSVVEPLVDPELVPEAEEDVYVVENDLFFQKYNYG